MRLGTTQKQLSPTFVHGRTRMDANFSQELVELSLRIILQTAIGKDWKLVRNGVGVGVEHRISSLNFLEKGYCL